jgi:predicted nucleic acid-binding Zn ribbon protein
MAASDMIPLNATAHRVVAELLRAAPLTPGKVEFAWRAAVGPALARVTRVRLDESGALDVDVLDVRWAPEIRRSSPLIVSRLGILLGADTVKQIRTHHA